MANTSFFAFFVLLITWICLIETTLGAAGWCYQCNSYNTGCQNDLDAVVMANNRVPCNGQCYVRVKDGVMSRGCSWEHGFMTTQLSYTPIFEREALWVFCDISLCNGSANMG